MPIHMRFHDLGHTHANLGVEADMPKENVGNPDHEVSLRNRASTEG